MHFTQLFGLRFLTFFLVVTCGLLGMVDGPTGAAAPGATNKVDSFATCEKIANEIVDDQESLTGSALRLSDLASFSGDKNFSPPLHFATRLEDGSLQAMKNHPNGFTAADNYIYFQFTRDNSGKVTDVNVKDAGHSYYKIHFKVDDAQNTCAIDTVTTNLVDSIKFDLGTCGKALTLSKTFSGLDHCNAFKPLNPDSPGKKRTDYIGPDANNPKYNKWFQDCVDHEPEFQRLSASCRGPEFLINYAKRYFAKPETGTQKSAKSTASIDGR